MVYNDKFENVKGKKTLLIIFNSIMFVFQLVIAFFFTSGVVEYYGTHISVMGALEMLLSILNISQGYILEYLLRLALVIVYIVVTVLIIKNCITSISYFIRGVFNKDEAKEKNTKEVMFYLLYENLGDIITFTFLFMALCFMSSVDFKITTYGMVTLVLALIAYLSTYIIRQYLKNYNIETIIYKSSATIIMLASFVLLILGLNIASIEQLILGLKVIVGGYHLPIVSLIALPILYIITQGYLIAYLADIWEYEDVLSSHFTRAKAKIIMGLIIAIVIIGVILKMFLDDLSTFDFKTIVQETPTLLTSIVLFVSFKFVRFEKKRLAIKPIKDENYGDNVEEKTEAISENAVAKVNDSEDKAVESLDITVQLTKYKDLLEKGLITQEEYAETKRKILGI